MPINGLFLKEGDVIPVLADYGFGVVRLLNGLKIRDNMPIDDQQVTANRTALASAGIPHWGYMEYNYDESSSGWAANSAYKQALEFVAQSKKGLSKISGLIVGLVEIMSPTGTPVPLPAAGTLKANLENWGKVILQETGKKPLLYSNPSMLRRVGDMVGVETMRLFNLAIANYNVLAPDIVYWSDYAFWDDGVKPDGTKVSGVWKFRGTREELSAFVQTGLVSIADTEEPTPPPVDPGTPDPDPVDPGALTIEQRLALVENRLALYDKLFEALGDIIGG